MQNSKLTLTKNNDKEILLVIAGYVSVYRLLQTYGYDRKDSSWQRFLKSNLTEKYDNPLLFVTVEQNRPIIIICAASLESQPVSNFVDKIIILNQGPAILKEDRNTFVEETSGVS